MRLAHLETSDGLRLAIAGRRRLGRRGAGVRGRAAARSVRPDRAPAPTRSRRSPSWPAARSSAAADAPLGSLLDRPGRVFCVGRNYVAHRDELKNRPSEWPEVFLRLPSTVTGPYADVTVPATSDRFDYEGEMGVVIGTGGRHIPAETAESHILGLCVVNDFTAREWQHRGGQWTAGKNFDRTLPVGPALVTPDELDWHDAAIRTVVSGEELQSARTSQLIFSVAEQIEFISTWTELVPGI